MRFYKFSSAFTLVLSGVCINEVRASDVTTDKLMIFNPIYADAGKVTLEKAYKGKEAAATVKSVDNKTSETKLTSVIEDRKPGTITVKPLAVNFSSLTFGLRKKTQLINGFPIAPYRSSFGSFGSRGEALGSSYDIELGIMGTSNVEFFTVLGFSHERPFEKVVVGMSPTFADNLAFDFKPRRSFELSLGGRYYWNTEKPWFPFVGFMGTVRFQSAIDSTVFSINNPLGLVTYNMVGSLRLQKRKSLLGGTLQVGADYQFNPFISLTLTLGLRYTQRTGMSYPVINGRQIASRDNHNLWSVPVMAALKLTF